MFESQKSSAIDNLMADKPIGTARLSVPQV
jgi:hypothetical protein